MKKALISVFLLLVFSSFAHSELNIELLGILEGENNGDHFGYSVANLGDINGDGYEDFGVGAHRYPERNDSGRVYIYFGGDPIDLEADIILGPPPSVEFFGAELARIGDISHDDIGEFLVHAIDSISDMKVSSIFTLEKRNWMMNRTWFFISRTFTTTAELWAPAM